VDKKKRKVKKRHCSKFFFLGSNYSQLIYIEEEDTQHTHKNTSERNNWRKLRLRTEKEVKQERKRGQQTNGQENTPKKKTLTREQKRLRNREGRLHRYRASDKSLSYKRRIEKRNKKASLRYISYTHTAKRAEMKKKREKWGDREQGS